MGQDYLGRESPDIQENEGEGTPMEVDGVKAMVAGVKSRGVSGQVSLCFCFLTHFLLGKRPTQICEGSPELTPHNPQFVCPSLCTYDIFHACQCHRLWCDYLAYTSFSCSSANFKDKLVRRTDVRKAVDMPHNLAIAERVLFLPPVSS
jgi:hypothetical protein